jgi:membrane-bound lytic murein transglycosylase D
MNKILKMRHIIFMLVLALAYPAASRKSINADYEDLSDEIRQRVKSMSSVVDMRYTNLVEKEIDDLIANKNLSRTLLGRAAMYFPMMEKVLVENGVPEELKYLSVIESGLVPYLSSGAGAAGLWQFMPSTAEMFGLKVKSTIDERKDAYKATQAAAKYLKKLHSIYGDWTLVLAAYNCGDGKLNKALKRSGARSYWASLDQLPEQTQSFVPRFIAASYLMNFYYIHELEPDHLPEDYVYSGTLKVKSKIELSTIAEDYQVSPEAIRRLNAIYTKGFIPESEEEEFTLTLPESIIYQYAEKNNLLDKIAEFSIASINRQNKRASESIKKDEIAVADIPTQKSPIIPINIPNRSVSIKEDYSIIKIVRLTKGKSLKDIAEEHGTDLAALIDYNNFSESNLPRLGDPIKIRI